MKLGKIPVNVLKHSVLQPIHTGKSGNQDLLCGAGLGEDCAVFACPEKTILATCAREAAVATKAATEEMVLSGDNLEEGTNSGAAVISMSHLLCKCANNVACGGAVPAYFEIVLLLPVKYPHEQLRLLMEEAQEAAKELNMTIVGGQTRVSNAVVQPVAVVTGYGFANAPEESSFERKKEENKEMDVVVTKWIGLEATQLLAKRHKQIIDDRYPSFLSVKAGKFDHWLSVIPEAAIAVRHGAAYLHDASEGGILAALWEISEGAKVGLDIDMRKLPIRQETVEICEACGANPYEMLSGGSLVILTERGTDLVRSLEQASIPAVIVGRTTKDKAKLLRKEDEIRYLDRPARDDMYSF